MRSTPILLALMTLALSFVAAAPPQKCTTTIQVFTCGRVPVEDRRVKIETRDGEKFKKRTDAQGRIVLDVCHEDISEVKISGVNTRKISSTTVVDSTDTEVSATITLNICGA